MTLGRWLDGSRGARVACGSLPSVRSSVVAFRRADAATLLLVLLLVRVASAQPVVLPGRTLLLFDHDGVDVASFELQVDGGAWSFIAATSDGPASEPGLLVWRVVLPVIASGGHVLKVRACNAFACAESDGLLVHVVGGPPRKPTNPRVLTP